MTCEDCIHYDVCDYYDGLMDLQDGDDCGQFKDKSKFVELKHGKWYVDSPFACSICDGLNESKDDYCPHCGAKMER